MKITKKLIKTGAGNIGIIYFSAVTAIFGKNLVKLANKAVSKEPFLEFLNQKKEYVSSLKLEDFIAKTKLGEGQFGNVYLVEDKLAKKYAIKCLQKNKLI